MNPRFVVSILVVALVAVMSGISPYAPDVEAQNRIPPVTNIRLNNGANPGEVVISWDIVPEATHYRIGYVNMETDYPLAKGSNTGDWINAFIYVDEDARNLRVVNGRAEYTVRRLAQGVRHAFTVLSATGIVNTRQDLIGSYSWPQNPRWQFLVVTDRGGACPTIPPTTGGPPAQTPSAKISLSDVDNTLGYQLTVVGSGFNAGSTATTYVLNRYPTSAESNRSGSVCQAIIAHGVPVGGGRVGSDGRVAVTFAVTEPTFQPGRVNHICMVDSAGRASVGDVEVFELETPTTGGHTGDDNICPITGLPIPPDGYLGVGDTRKWVNGLASFRLDSATTPTSVLLADGSVATPVAGTKYLELCGTLANNLDSPFNFQPGVQNNLSTDRGLGFVDVLGWPDDPVPSGGQETGCDVWEIPVAAQTAVYAVLASDPDHDFATLFRIDLPAN